MQRECLVEEQALLTVLLHATKHPTTAVNGLLLGTVAPAASDGSAAAVTVAAAVPVCHSFITLAPVIETALAQVEQHVKEQQGASPGLRLVGYYQCNERFADGDLGAGRRVADRVEAACPDSVALVLDSPALEAQLKAVTGDGAAAERPEQPPPLQLFVKDGARGWVRVPPAGSSGKGGGLKCSSSGVAARLAQMVGEGRHNSLADFEEHLDNISVDWLNPGLLEGPA